MEKVKKWGSPSLVLMPSASIPAVLDTASHCIDCGQFTYGVQNHAPTPQEESCIMASMQRPSSILELTNEEKN